MDKNKIASLLETLCERPFVGDPEGQVAAMRELAHQPETEPEGEADAVGANELAAILSGTATATQTEAFHEAAAQSDALRLEAQSALAFVDGVEQSPLTVPAHLMGLVGPRLASGQTRALVAAGSPGRASVWSRLLLPRRQVAAACVVLLMGGGLSWSLLFRDGELARDMTAQPAPPPQEPVDALAPVPAAVLPSVDTPSPSGPSGESANQGGLGNNNQAGLGNNLAPLAAPSAVPLVPAPAAHAPSPLPAFRAAPLLAPAQVLAPPAQAQSQPQPEPCPPTSVAGGVERPPPTAQTQAVFAAKPALPGPQLKTAAVAPEDQGCPDVASAPGRGAAVGPDDEPKHERPTNNARTRRTERSAARRATAEHTRSAPEAPASVPAPGTARSTFERSR